MKKIVLFLLLGCSTSLVHATDDIWLYFLGIWINVVGESRKQPSPVNVDNSQEQAQQWVEEYAKKRSKAKL